MMGHRSGPAGSSIQIGTLLILALTVTSLLSHCALWRFASAFSPSFKFNNHRQNQENPQILRKSSCSQHPRAAASRATAHQFPSSHRLPRISLTSDLLSHSRGYHGEEDCSLEPSSSSANDEIELKQPAPAVSSAAAAISAAARSLVMSFLQCWQSWAPQLLISLAYWRCVGAFRGLSRRIANRKAVASSTHLACLRWWSANPPNSGISRPHRHRHRERFAAAAVAALLAWRLATEPATAKFSYELSENPTLSIRPGMTSQQVQEVEESGELPLAAPTTAPTSATSSATTSSAAKASETMKRNKKKDSVYGDYYDEEEGDDFLDEVDVIGSSVVVGGSGGGAAFSSSSSVGSQKDRAAAARLAASTRSNFASYQKGKSAALTTKVAAALFVPTFGGMFVREFLRRRREEEYVRKGLEILEAQKAEYFNVTSTSSDSDVQDALKGLKNKNQTKAKGGADDEDDDDEDDDDDDEDDKPQPKMRRTPRPPPKGDGGGSSSGGGGGDDPGYGRPSDDDIDKLRRLMGRS